MRLTLRSKTAVKLSAWATQPGKKPIRPTNVRPLLSPPSCSLSHPRPPGPLQTLHSGLRFAGLAIESSTERADSSTRGRQAKRAPGGREDGPQTIQKKATKKNNRNFQDDTGKGPRAKKTKQEKKQRKQKKEREIEVIERRDKQKRETKETKKSKSP